MIIMQVWAVIFLSNPFESGSQNSCFGDTITTALGIFILHQFALRSLTNDAHQKGIGHITALDLNFGHHMTF